MQICQAAFGEELLLITAGSRAVIRFLPPLNISSAEIEEAIAKLERAIEKVCTTHDAAAAAEAGPNPAAVATGAGAGGASGEGKKHGSEASPQKAAAAAAKPSAVTSA